MDKLKKMITSITDVTKRKLESNSSKNTNTELLRSTNVRIVQNFLLIWLDESIGEVKNKHISNALNKLRKVVNTIYTFNTMNECIDFITDIKDERIFMISSVAFGQTVVPIVHEMSQVNTIYIFCGSKNHHEQRVKEWQKVKGVFTDITSICEALKQTIQECEQNTISMSFIAPSTRTKSPNLDQFDQCFIYTQIFKEILLTIDFEQHHIDYFISYCRQQFSDNTKELKNIDKFEREYHKHGPIWWYTSRCFLYFMLNRAVRTMEFDLLIIMGFFVRDLHKHITQLHSEQYVDHTDSNSFTVYRGQGLSQSDFNQLVKTKGGLLSFNNFLSTHINRKVSLNFIHQTIETSDMVGVLFVMEINPFISSTPFANTCDVSYLQKEEEEEILFSICSIFRIGHIKQIDNNNRLWQVNLTLTSINDPQLYSLNEYIGKEIFPHLKGWHRLTRLLIKLAQFDKAQQVCELLLKQKIDDHEEANIYQMLGMIMENQKEYSKAITYYEKSIEIKEKILSATHPDLAASYNNIGSIYNKMIQYSKALLYYKKDLDISKKTLPSNHSHLATSYRNIGRVYKNMGQYSKALSYYEKEFEICKETLSPNHPSLAISYNNIALVYDKMGEYSKALSSQQETLEIYKRILPANHPHLANSYTYYGSIYNKMGQYSKALSFHEKALKIHKEILPPNHPDLAISYGNFGRVYDNMHNYSKALSYYEKGLEIRQKTLPSNHPHLATSYNNIGSIYNKIGEYLKALLYYEKALEIQQESFPLNHPHLPLSYNNIGKIYSNIGDYSKACSFYKHARDLAQHSLPEDHPHLQIYMKNVESIKKKL